MSTDRIIDDLEWGPTPKLPALLPALPVALLSLALAVVALVFANREIGRIEKKIAELEAKLPALPWDDYVRQQDKTQALMDDENVEPGTFEIEYLTPDFTTVRARAVKKGR